jgi:hypothetical protein
MMQHAARHPCLRHACAINRDCWRVLSHQMLRPSEWKDRHAHLDVSYSGACTSANVVGAEDPARLTLIRDRHRNIANQPTKAFRLHPTAGISKPSTQFELAHKGFRPEATNHWKAHTEQSYSHATVTLPSGHTQSVVSVTQPCRGNPASSGRRKPAVHLTCCSQPESGTQLTLPRMCLCETHGY